MKNTAKVFISFKTEINSLFVIFVYIEMKFKTYVCYSHDDDRFVFSSYV